ncbi:acyl-CoA dehydrogenase family protein [Desulfatibacillum aliphaticivorans]|uniref:acyl-CoA dehydrogenase family protein n=1 Tax=Desulfatibacillum aliphaticivorans TaxID=218208 RepID=UPI000428A57F|nr:acyl-CoA dehydrogenase family protein [Desulfatibacillum aliphaticivorans]
MEILQYTPEHHAFREQFRAYLAENVIPHIPQWEADHIVPPEVWRDLGRNGYLCTATPKEYGGHGMDFLYSVIITEEIGKTGFCGLTLGLHSDIVVPYIETFGTEEQKKKFLPGCVSGEIISSVAMTEPGTGSDLSSMSTTAVEDGDDIIIDGTKTFISNGINTNLCVVAARDPNVENPYEAISLYLVEGDRPGFERGRHLDKMGFNSQDTSELFFSKCRIPKENLLGQKGGGFIILMQKLQQERLICAIGAVVAAEQMTERMIQYCKETTRNGKPLSKFQAIQFELVEMATEAKLGRAFLDKLIAEHVAGEQVVVEVSMAKYWTTDLAKRTIDRAISIVGEPAMAESLGLAQAMRDIRILPIFAGTNEVMKIVAARFMGL